MSRPGPECVAFRLATYNIHSSVGRDRRCDPARIAAVIKELDADVLALQEVQSCHGALDVPAFFAEQTGMTPVAGPIMLRGDGSYGNALLTRVPPTDVQRINLSVPGREPRGPLDVVVPLGALRLRVIATHLGLRPAERRRQIEQLLAQMESERSCPTVLAGDLNEWFLRGRPLRRLHAHFGETPAPATYPSGWSVFALDRMWVKPRERLLGLTVHNSPLARQASDHLPLVGLLA